jgi:hypothetical protein
MSNSDPLSAASMEAHVRTDISELIHHSCRDRLWLDDFQVYQPRSLRAEMIEALP